MVFLSSHTMSSENQAGAAAPEQLADAVKKMDVKEKAQKKKNNDTGAKEPLEVRLPSA